MKILTRVGSVLLMTLFCLSVTGCMSVPVIYAMGAVSAAPTIGAMASPNSPDASSGIFTPAAPLENFDRDIKAVAKDINYQVLSIVPNGDETTVSLMRQAMVSGVASALRGLMGKDWKIMATIRYQKVTNKVIITTNLKGNDLEESGTADAAVATIKEGLAKKFGAERPTTLEKRKVAG